VLVNEKRNGNAIRLLAFENLQESFTRRWHDLFLVFWWSAACRAQDVQGIVC